MTTHGTERAHGRFSGMVRALALAVAIAGTQTGCTLLPEPDDAATVRTYTLEPTLPAPGATARSETVLLLAPVRAGPGYATPRMAYTETPSELAYFATNEWVDEPAKLVEAAVLQALDRGGSFRAVVSGPGAPLADVALDIELVVLRQEFGSGGTPGGSRGGSMVRLGLRAVATDVASARVIAARRFEVTEPAPSADPAGGVVAATRALTRVLPDIVSFAAAAR
ncbi:MAG: membrane integrity-associated transporter subunit PqiC [Ectothiorhodospiraceae bacterium]|nr:membrane integrity-associated transporter subunit PqiC [Chromatiales bacterium]MCP5156921.1 membrane integrity-associated transporter subunit PqiC [Ectothiorhodospiraceae bacterium]